MTIRMLQLQRTMLFSLIVLISFIGLSYGFVSNLPGDFGSGRYFVAQELSHTSIVRTRPVARFATISAPPKVSSILLDGVGRTESLPWSHSIHPARELTYMPMFRDQLGKLSELNMRKIPIDERFVDRQSSVKPARIGSMCFQNEKFRKVRMTYFDAGDAVQVFNTVWYPSYEYDLPILGMDLISLGKSRVLNVIDFQPLHNTDAYSAQYIDHLSAIREKYPDLHGTLSGKIYHDALFFSKQMLFGRMTDESKVMSTVFPAYEEYQAAYTALMDRATPDYSPERMASVRARQSAYDAYNAVKDPAVGLYDAYFGKEWSDAFVHDFLFDNCREGDYKTTASVSSAVAGVSTTSTCNALNSAVHNNESPISQGGDMVAGAKSCVLPQPVHNFHIDTSTGEVKMNRQAAADH